MKRTKSISLSLLIILLTSFSTLSIGSETTRVWLTSACYTFHLSIWDKFEGAAEPAKFVITSNNGRVFVAERSATGDPSSSEVIFPDNFRDAKSNRAASVDCFNGEKYTWEIYINDVLRDSGTIGFTRNQRK